MRSRILIAAMCAIIAGGCITASRSRFLIVANASGSPVSDVSVESGGAALYTAHSIDSDAAAPGRRFEPGTSQASSIRWTGQDGQVVTRAVQLAPPSPGTFRGRIYIQIETNARVRVFFVEDSRAGGGELPWTEREPWEGAPFVPGLSE
jgi:hypothetical protein